MQALLEVILAFIGAVLLLALASQSLIELVKAGLGVAALAGWAVEPAVRAGVVRALPWTRHGYKRTWSAATLKDVARVPHVSDFVRLVAEHPPFASPSRVGTRPRRNTPNRRRVRGV